jgi:hypothetical protein
VPKWHTGESPRRCRKPPVPPPSQHRLPSQPPPYPYRDLKCAILAQFGGSGRIGGGSGSRGCGGMAWEVIWIDVQAKAGPPAGIGQPARRKPGSLRTSAVLIVARASPRRVRAPGLHTGKTALL